MSKINIQYFKTAIGELILGSSGNQLCILDFKYRKTRRTVDNRIKKGLTKDFVEADDSLLRKTRIQIDEYLSGERKHFSIPFQTVGTYFQNSVWNALQKIPYGTTCTYLQLAQRINKKRAVRAVANAIGANSIALIIPCHRVIETSGKLGGYAGELPIKHRLLKVEELNS